MKNLKLYVLIGVVFLALLGASFLAGRATLKKAHQDTMNNYAALLDTVSRYKVKMDGLELDVYEKGQLILSQKDAIKTGLVEKRLLNTLNIKYLNQITDLKGYINILMDSIKHGGSVVYVPIPAGESKPAIILPFAFNDSTEYYKLSGLFDVKGKMSARFEVPPFKIKLISGTDAKTGREKISVIPSNKFIVIDDLQSVDIPRPKERVKRFGIGVSIGAMIQASPPYRIAPGAGITLNYNFIQFF